MIPMTNEDFFSIIQNCIVHNEHGMILPSDENLSVTFMNTQNGLLETKTISRDDLTEVIFHLHRAFNRED